MLKTLDIENIAVIEKASVDFSNGLNVLTGETGAGKSIVVDSLNAILGERTSKELIRHDCDSANVSALFEDVNDDVSNKLTELGFSLEEDKSLLLSRKISLTGKSVCKINGKTATVSMLKEIGSHLVNIHGQHDSQALLNPDLQYKYIDMLCRNKSVIKSYKESFKELISVRRRLKALTGSEADKDRELELLNYQIDEIEKSEIFVGERDNLTAKRKLIQQSEEIANSLYSTLQSINGNDDFNGAQTLIQTSISSLSGFDECKKIYEILDSVNDSLEKAKDEVELLLNKISFDPDELEKTEERLDLLYKLSNKYGATEEQILEFLQDAKDKRNSIIYSDEELERLNNEYDRIFEKTVELAENLSKLRKETALEFEKHVTKELAFLDMPNIKFTVSFSKGNLSSNGFDKIEFLISTNVGEPPKSLAKIASGGELSRIMLAIKNILSYNDTIDTLIFDEIDTGVSGSSSRKIGLKLSEVSKNTQVICVTHSAQIASVADEHFLIKKDFTDKSTFTKVLPLDFEGRKRELARIMGGLNISETMLKSAEELLNGN